MICYPRLPFFPEAEGDFGDAARRAGKPRVAPGFGDEAGSELGGREGKAMTTRETAKRNAEQRVALDRQIEGRGGAGGWQCCQQWMQMCWRRKVTQLAICRTCRTRPSSLIVGSDDFKFKAIARHMQEKRPDIKIYEN